MSTTSRRISAKTSPSRNSHTPGKTKGGFCVRPKDFGIATNTNPNKGDGLKGARKSAYDRLWTRYKGARGNESAK